MSFPQSLSFSSARSAPLALVASLLLLGGCGPDARKAATPESSPSAESTPTLHERMAERDRLEHVLARTDDLLAMVRTARELGMPIGEADVPDWRVDDQGFVSELLALEARWRAATWNGTPEERLEAMLRRDVIVGGFVEERIPSLERSILRFEEMFEEAVPEAAAAGG